MQALARLSRPPMYASSLWRCMRSHAYVAQNTRKRHHDVPNLKIQTFEQVHPKTLPVQNGLPFLHCTSNRDLLQTTNERGAKRAWIRLSHLRQIVAPVVLPVWPNVLAAGA